MSRSAGAPPTCGANPSSPNAATLSASVIPASEPAISAEYTDLGRRFLARRWATATDSNQTFFIGRARSPAGSRRTVSRARAAARLLRHVDRGLRERRVAARGQRAFAMAEHAFRVGSGQRQSGEELSGHAPPAALVEQPAARARTRVLRLAQRGEQLRLAPHAREPTRLAHVPREELVVDHERARVHVADRVDQAHHPPGAAQIQARAAPRRSRPGGRTSPRSAHSRRGRGATRTARAAGRRSDEARPTRRRRARTAAGASAAAERGSGRRAL